MNIDWGKAPEEFPLWLEGIGEHAKHSGWYRRAGEVFEAAICGQFRTVREGQFFTVHRNPEWDGRGLPPVGVPIEMKHKRATIEWARPDFYEEELAWVGRERFVTVDEKVGDLADWIFRPVRTPEQIAKTARSKACDEIYGIIASPPVREGNRSDMAEALYDAGYRKFEIVEEDV